MRIDNIRLSNQARDQLIGLKRHTSITNWNVLCRWAFCLSLAEPSVPPKAEIPADSSVEMTWRVFAGAYEDVYMGLLLDRCARDGIEMNQESVARYFRLHLHRGIGYMAGNKKIRSIANLVSMLPLEAADEE